MDESPHHVVGVQRHETVVQFCIATLCITLTGCISCLCSLAPLLSQQIVAGEKTLCDAEVDVVLRRTLVVGTLQELNSLCQILLSLIQHVTYGVTAFLGIELVE